MKKKLISIVVTVVFVAGAGTAVGVIVNHSDNKNIDEIVNSAVSQALATTESPTEQTSTEESTTAPAVEKSTTAKSTAKAPADTTTAETPSTTKSISEQTTYIYVIDKSCQAKVNGKIVTVNLMGRKILMLANIFMLKMVTKFLLMI